jgi:hypothetical protein
METRGPTCVRASGPRQSGNGEMQKDMPEDASGSRAILESFFPSHLTMRGKVLGGGWAGEPNSAGDGLREALSLRGVASTRKLIWKGSAR